MQAAAAIRSTPIAVHGSTRPFDGRASHAPSRRIARSTSPSTLHPDPRAHAPAHRSARAGLFVRHPRARRYVIRVAADGAVRVTIPRGGSKREAAAFAERERRGSRSSSGERIAQRRDARGTTSERGRPCRRRVDERALRERAKRELPRAAAGAGGAARADRVARQRAQSALALGIVLAQRSHLPELAAGADAGRRFATT